MGRRSRILLTIALALSLNAGQLSVIAPPANAATTLNPWSSTGSLATAREEHTATALADGTVLVAGGQQEIQNPPGTVTRTVLSSAEIYDLPQARLPRRAHCWPRAGSTPRPFLPPARS